MGAPSPRCFSDDRPPFFPLSKSSPRLITIHEQILLGVHDNGLTHLVFMAPTRISTVIGIFCPPGFAHDYQWTTRALGMKYFGVWNDSCFTHDPECFQRDGIMVWAAVLVQVVEGRVGGRFN